MMKKTIAGLLICCAPICFAPTLANAAELTPPEMALGHWVTTVDQSALIEQMLAKVPKEHQAMALEMMKQQMEKNSTTQQCITAEMLSTFDEQIKNSLSENQDCEFNISESTSKIFAAQISCDGPTINIVTKVINPKRNETTVVTTAAGMGETTITSVSEWKSSDCPAGL